VEQDLFKAAKLYRQAALQGHARAQYNFACCLELGEGVEQDKAEAFHWYKQSAKSDYYAALAKLGVVFDFGQFGERNTMLCVYYYRRASSLNDMESKDRFAELTQSNRFPQIRTDRDSYK
jgi:hypothetical protein